MNKLLLLLLFAVGTVSIHAQQEPLPAKKKVPPIPSTVLTAKGWTDYTYNVQNPNDAVKDDNAFDIRRVNVGIDHLFSRTVSVYAQMEANSSVGTPGANYFIFLKQAFVEVKNILPQMRVVMGLSPTPAVETSERIWKYRPLQKLPLDYYGMAPTVDDGIAIKGKIDPDGIVAYHVMVGNGNAALKEVDRLKRIYASLNLTPAAGFTLEGYADFQNAGNERYRATFKGLIGVEDAEYALGLEGIYRINHHTLTQWYDQSPYAISLYGWVSAGGSVRVVYRGDYYDDDQNKPDAGMRSMEGTFGVDFMPVSEVHIIPNVIYTSYTNKNQAASTPGDAVTVRLTASFNFSSPL